MAQTQVIRDIIIRGELGEAKHRLSKLEAMKAPAPVINALRSQVAALEAGEIKVGGDATLLDAVTTSVEMKKGRGGKVFIEFDNGIRYFPKAKYGKFISQQA